MRLPAQLDALRALVGHAPDAALTHFLRLADLPGFHHLGQPISHEAPALDGALAPLRHLPLRARLASLPGLDCVHGAVLIDEVPGLLLWLGPDAGGLLATWPERGRRHLRVLPPDRRVRTRARAAAQNHGAV